MNKTLAVIIRFYALHNNLSQVAQTQRVAQRLKASVKHTESIGAEISV